MQFFRFLKTSVGSGLIFPGCFLLCIALNSGAQIHGVYSEMRERPYVSGVRSVIWSENFADGFAAGWTKEEAGGIADWEYRGLATNPSVQTGNRGGCALPGSDGRIDSPTWQDGFVLFDSFWWDNPSLPCSANNFGSGPAPGPHLAMLTSPAINLGAYQNVALVFNQFFRNYDAQTYVQVSINGTEWTTVFNNNTNVEAGLRSNQVTIPVGELAGGQPQVYIRFVFEGFGYCWQLDDIKIIEINGNDLVIQNATYGAFDIDNPDHSTGYEWMEYSKYPDELAPLLRLSSEVKNIGSATQNDVRLEVRIKKISNQTIVLNSLSESGLSLLPGDTDTLVVDDFQMPAVKGKYELRYSVSQNQQDDAALNNRDTSYFSITDAVYARDQDFTNAVYVPSGSFSQLPYEVGNVFYVPAGGLSCYSVSVAVAAGTFTPGSIYAALYEFEYDETPFANLIAVTDELAVDAGMINSYGQNNFTTLFFDQPVPLTEGKAYLAVAGTPDGGEQVLFAMSGASPELTSWVKYSTGQFFYLNRVPMVRMNFAAVIEAETDQVYVPPVGVYPNPVESLLNIPVSDFINQSAEIDISDVSGNLVRRFSGNYIEEPVLRLNMDFLSPGVYLLKTRSEQNSATFRFVKF